MTSEQGSHRTSHTSVHAQHTSISLGGTWKIQEQARRESLKLAAEFAASARKSREDSHRISAEKERVCKQLEELREELLSSQVSQEAVTHNLLKTRATLAAYATAAIVQQRREASDQSRLYLLERQLSEAEVGKTALEERYLNLRLRYAAEVRENDFLRSALEQERNRASSHKVALDQQIENCRLLRKVQVQNDQRLALLLKEKLRFQEAIRKLQEQIRCRRGFAEGGKSNRSAPSTPTGVADGTKEVFITPPRKSIVNIKDESPAATSTFSATTHTDDSVVGELAFAALEAELRRSRRTSEDLIKERDAALSELNKATSKCESLLVQLRNRNGKKRVVF